MVIFLFSFVFVFFFFHLHSISNRTVRSTGGANLVFDAWQRNVLLYASLVKCGISRRFTITWRPIAIPPAVWSGSLPLNQVTVGSGRPVEMEKKMKKKKVKHFKNCKKISTLICYKMTSVIAMLEWMINKI